MRKERPDDIDPGHLKFIINHVFLPPKLPQQSDEGTGAKNATFLKLIRHVAEVYHQNMTGSENLQWVPIVQMLNTLCLLENGSSLPAEAFLDAVARMTTGGNYICRPIYWNAY